MLYIVAVDIVDAHRAADGDQADADSQASDVGCIRELFAASCRFRPCSRELGIGVSQLPGE
ncbi:MAG: hypothetical protein R3E50_15800 [Halioglobus sp.]